MSSIIDLQLATEQAYPIPPMSQFEQWVNAALPKDYPQVELTIRLVEKAESAYLNQTYRKRSGPTNILSFPFRDDAPLPVPLLGDLIVCVPLMIEEAAKQNKPLEFHWAHLIIHGTLHLLGYDHIEENEAIAMEALECDILHSLGFSDPYGDR